MPMVGSPRRAIESRAMTSVDEQAAAFWRRVGDPPSFPRDLEAAILWGLPLAIVKLPRLRPGAVDDWFRRRGRAHGVGGADRALRACLVAFRGRGVIFLDAADAAAEFRFSLAHEAAHFIVDYLVPRERFSAGWVAAMKRSSTESGRRGPMN